MMSQKPVSQFTRLPKPTKLRSMGLSKYDHIFEGLEARIFAAKKFCEEPEFDHNTKNHGESFRFFGNLCGIPKTHSGKVAIY